MQTMKPFTVLKMTYKGHSRITGKVNLHYITWTFYHR